jgi:hypothetical protein
MFAWLGKVIAWAVSPAGEEVIDEVTAEAKAYLQKLQDDTVPVPLPYAAIEHQRAQIAKATEHPAGPPTCPPSLPPSAPPVAMDVHIPPPTPRPMPVGYQGAGPPPRLSPPPVLPVPPPLPPAPRPKRRST